MVPLLRRGGWILKIDIFSFGAEKVDLGLGLSVVVAWPASRREGPRQGPRRANDRLAGLVS